MSCMSKTVNRKVYSARLWLFQAVAGVPVAPLEVQHVLAATVAEALATALASGRKTARRWQITANAVRASRHEGRLYEFRHERVLQLGEEGDLLRVVGAKLGGLVQDLAEPFRREVFEVHVAPCGFLITVTKRCSPAARCCSSRVPSAGPSELK